MPRLRQRKAEQRDFESFARDYDLPEGAVEYSDKPDVLIRGERVLGIELANLHKVDGGRSDSEKVQSIHRAEVIALAEQLHRSRGGRSIELWVDFSPDHPILSVKKTATALAEIASSIANEVDGHESCSAYEDSPEIRFLYHTGKAYDDARWRSCQSHSVPALATERVREIVAAKSRKISGYRKCAAYWLLLIVDFWDPSQDQYIHWPQSERLGPTPFERVLLYKPAFRQIVRIPQ